MCLARLAILKPKTGSCFQIAPQIVVPGEDLRKDLYCVKEEGDDENPDKTTCTLFTPDPVEYKSNESGPQNKQRCTTHGNAPKCSTLDSKLTYSTHIHDISVQAHKPLQMIKALMVTYKAVIRPALEHTSSIWTPLASSTNINKLQVMQNSALRTATCHIMHTNIQHLHDKTLILPIHEYLQLHTSQYKQKTQHPSHSLHKHTTLQG